MKRKNESKWLNSAFIAAGLAVASSLAATSAEAASFSLFYDPTNGVTVSTNGPTGTGVTGQADFAFSGSGTSYTLDLTLTNTSPNPPITSSRLVGYAFNLPDLVQSFTYNSLNSSPFGSLFAPAILSGGGAQNQGFDLCIRSTAGGGNCNGGNPTTGLNNGESGTVQFALTTANTTLADLESAFLTTLTDTAIFNSGLRYQAIAGGSGSSDKLFNGFNNPPPPPGPAVPEPMTVLGTGMALGLGTLFQKQRSKQKKQGLKA
jgi:hypothetical protein